MSPKSILLKRGFDILFSSFGILLLSPVFVLLSIAIVIESKGSVFYKQLRFGIDKKVFILLKFLSMTVCSDKYGLLTVGNQD
jgi:lipopolysaccharide/colanic/teichoic acid biosynthesis glycosyltransferase